MPPSHVPYFFYPRVYRVTDVGFVDSGWGEPATEGWVTKPECRPASLEKLDSRHAYLMDNGDYLYLYLGNQVPDGFIQSVKHLIPNDLGLRLRKLQRLAIQRSHCLHTS
jgi:hypothetical protein